MKPKYLNRAPRLLFLWSSRWASRIGQRKQSSMTPIMLNGIRTYRLCDAERTLHHWIKSTLYRGLVIKSYLYSRYWTGTSLQFRLLREVSSNANYVSLCDRQEKDLHRKRSSSPLLEYQRMHNTLHLRITIIAICTCSTKVCIS